MDVNAEYRRDHEPPGVVFQFVINEKGWTGAISLQALAALHGGAISTAEEAVTVYRRRWRRIHAAALGLHVTGQALCVRCKDVT